MFITKEEIKENLKEEDCWISLSPKEKQMLLLYCTNGHDELEAFNDVYIEPGQTRVVKFPGSKAARIVAKEDFRDCFEKYASLLQEMVSVKANAHIWNYYFTLATYNPFDYINIDGDFKYESIEEAQEKLGYKACVITGIETTMHPKFPEKTIRKVSLYPRKDALRELSKYTKFYGEAEVGGGLAMPDVNISIGNMEAEFDKDIDKKNREKLEIIK